ncbi:hypothetical protein LMG28614_00151 [Paraburkholderia ultramafica]|uniref:Uncharacterized protein n=1 Tax=Paraburkholderia ultramafica TaxID=1544867 RepID=A0A6S7B107_9BURK|nr:DUF1634 domain-containing protein [Paraburkholderia ultramafica]CAB3776127.1 hypothetical protein LMG28614_00151 [Paraburkholderia ultramafica]
MSGAAAALDLHYTLWLFAVSLGASALGGMLGMASGIFIVPVLTMFGHLDIHVAIGASIVSVIACSHGGAHPAAAGMSIVTMGIALFILLPIMRLILMLGVFLHQRDYRFSAIAALVLAIVAAGLLVGAA